MISIKKQTRRTTKWLPNFAENINIFYSKKRHYPENTIFEFGIVTSKNWGDFSENNIEDPLIQMKIEGEHIEMKLSHFIKKFKKK